MDLTKLQLVATDHPVLHEKARKVNAHVGDNVDGLIRRMFEIIDERLAVGLAAPQLGVPLCVICVDYKGTRLAMINPVIAKRPGKLVTSIGEGCLSYPGQRVDVRRHKRVKVRGLDGRRVPINIDARGHLAFIFQHEIDHLHGVTIG